MHSPIYGAVEQKSGTSPLGGKDVICQNLQPEGNESQQERQDECATTGTTTGGLTWGQHKSSNTDAYKDPGCTSWGNYSIANANNTRSCRPQILNNVSD